MGKKAENKRRNRSFSAGSFNARGFTEHHNKEKLVRDTN